MHEELCATEWTGSPTTNASRIAEPVQPLSYIERHFQCLLGIQARVTVSVVTTAQVSLLN